MRSNPMGQVMGSTKVLKEWAGEVCVYKNQEEIDRALGTGRDEYGLMTVWWD